MKRKTCREKEDLQRKDCSKLEHTIEKEKAESKREREREIDMKRSRKQREESAEEESEYEPVKWEEFVEANVVSQLMKVPAIPLEFSQFEELVKSWSYQYSVMWLSNVCSGYWTQNFTSGKAWWIDIVFDERIMLQDYLSLIHI